MESISTSIAQDLLQNRAELDQVNIFVDQASVPAFISDAVFESANKFGLKVARHNMPQVDLSWTDRQEAADVVSALRHSSVVLFLGLRPHQLDGIFRLRLAQLLDDGEVLAARSVVILVEDLDAPRLSPGFAQRARSSWPFAELDLISTNGGLSQTALSAIGIEVGEYSLEAVDKALRRETPASLVSEAKADQTIAMMVQPLCGRCGSSTAFENELASLVSAGHFVLRVHINEHFSQGGTIERESPRRMRENSVNFDAHVNAAAVRSVPADAHRLQNRSAYHEFVLSLLGRYECDICDPAAAAAATRAEVVIMNHVITAGFVLKICPDAKILLDTHDYFCRWAFDHARQGSRDIGFGSRGELLRMARLEASVWRLADICTSVNLAEQTQVGRHNPRSVLVLPRPYVPLIQSPPTEVAWDALVSGDNHAFNVASIRWLIETVLPLFPELARLRIAVAGRVGSEFDKADIESKTGLRFLGFVDDLEAVRAQSSLTLVPDRAGTGIAVKTLTALASGHPIVTTDIGLRGFDAKVADVIPGHQTADAFASDLLRLLAEPARLRERRDATRMAYQILAGGCSYDRALQMTTGPDEAKCKLRASFVKHLNDIARAHSALRQRHAATISPGADLEFCAGSPVTSLLGKGWHSGESWGRWIDGGEATLRLPSDHLVFRDTESLVVHVQALADDTDLELHLADTCLGRLVTSAGEARLSFPLPVGTVPSEGSMELTFRTQRVLCPGDILPTEDRRMVGIGIRRIVHMSRQRRLLPIRLVLGSPDADEFLDFGFYGREPWGRWTHASEASVTLPLDDAEREKRKLLVLDTFIHPLGCTLTIVINGITLASREVGDSVTVWPVPDSAITGRSDLNILLRPSHSYRPSEDSNVSDHRVLGIGIRSLHIEDEDTLFG